MRINFGASIFCLDGQSDSRIQEMILEVQSKEILYFVIGKSSSGRLSLLIPNLVERSKNGKIFVRLNKEQLSQLPDYIESRWVNMVTMLPNPALPDEGGAKLPSPWLLSKEGSTSAPEIIPHGTKPQDAGHIEELARATFSLKKYTRVNCIDTSIGILKGVGLDDLLNRVTFIIALKGFLFTHETIVPSEWITGVSGNVIAIGADSKQVRDLIGPPSGPYLAILEQAGRTTESTPS